MLGFFSSCPFPKAFLLDQLTFPAWFSWVWVPHVIILIWKGRIHSSSLNALTSNPLKTNNVLQSGTRSKTKLFYMFLSPSPLRSRSALSKDNKYPDMLLTLVKISLIEIFCVQVLPPKESLCIKLFSIFVNRTPRTGSG